MERTFEGRACPVLELLKSDAYAETVLLDTPRGRVVLKTSRFRPCPARAEPVRPAAGAGGAEERCGGDQRQHPDQGEPPSPAAGHARR
jgi:hypothetical protein